MTPSLRVARPVILAVLLVGIVLTLALAPSALEAQQTPPGTAGYPDRQGPTATEIALEPLARDGGDPTWWIVSAIAVVVVGSGAGVLYLRRKA